MAAQNVTANKPFTTGDDIESALSIINTNGGGDPFDLLDDEDTEVQRWAFPRFDGADRIGTCDVDLPGHLGVHALVDSGKKADRCVDFVVDPGNIYLSRPGIGYESDVETYAGWLSAPRSIVGMIYLRGEPGTGKTALTEAAVCHVDGLLFTHICTPDDTRDSLMLRFVGEGNGEGGTPFTYGPLARAVRAALDNPDRLVVFYGDEFPLLPDGVKPVFYQLADGRRVLSGGNVDGSDMVVGENFRMVLSGNPDIRGASLPEPLASRAASTTLTVETSAEFLTALGIEESLVAAWDALKSSGLWYPQVREMRVADYWFNAGLLTQAASAFVPEHCPESQREKVRDMVVSYLGADIRADGRLVVS